ncbi:MAG: hypothetical protein AAF408_06350 [Pseudomonadota bacterium]
MTYVTEAQQADLLFSVCTLVASDEKYDRLRDSFESGGFNASNTEFIALDNRQENRFDGYGSLREVYPLFRGKYILFTHDDIELAEDDFDHLRSVLGALEADDPNWTIAGNSGWTVNNERHVRYLEDPHGSFRDIVKPVEVSSLDENFLILRRSKMVFPSLDLKGFHLFATDLCLQSRAAGGRAYVVPFFVKHLSGGSASAEFDTCRDALVRKYEKPLVSGRLRTPATVLYVGLAGAVQKFMDAAYDRILSKTRALVSSTGLTEKAATTGGD